MQRIGFLLWLGIALGAAEPVRVQLPYHAQFAHAGFYAAIVDGLYDQRGIEVVLLPWEPGSRPVTAVIQGRADVTVTTGEILIDLGRGLDLFLLAQIQQRSPSCVLVRAESPIRTLKDLERVPRERLVGPANGPDGALWVGLTQAGMNPDRLFPRSKRAEDLDRFARGELDILPAYRSNEPFLLAAMGVPTPEIPQSERPLAFPGTLLVANGSRWRRTPGELTAFREATLEGWHAALKDPDRIVEVILSRFGGREAGLTRERLLDEARVITEHIEMDRFPLGDIRGERLEAAAALMRAADLPAHLERNQVWVPTDHQAMMELLLGMGMVAALITTIALVLVTRHQLLNLHRSRRQYRGLVDMAQGFALLRATAHGQQGLRLEVASPSLQHITGHPPEWFVADPGRLNSVLVPEDRPALAEAIALSRQAGEDIRLRLRLRRPDGSVATLLLHAHRNDEPSLPAWDGILIDVSAETAAEDERRRLSEELTQAKRHESLGVLAGGIAHDFNNLLGAIRGQVELVKSAIEHDAVAHKRCIRAIEGVDRAAGLVRQLLAYTGRGRIELRDLDPGRELNSLVELLGPSLPNGVELHLDLAPDLPWIAFDPSQFHQVVMNLVINAAESYNSAPGRVDITVRRQGEHLLLDVADHGCGMDPETQSRMFDPYFTTKSKGHGLGLAAVHGIIRDRGGNIQCRSRAGQGTTFSVSLPCHVSRASTTRTERRTPGNSHLLPILVADDEDLMREATADLVRSLNYQVITASDGTSAAGMLDQPMLAVILDDRMPGTSGLSLLHRLRAQGSTLPVVLISGMMTSADLGGELINGYTRFLAKPFDRDQLAQALNGAISGQPDDGSSSSLSTVRQLTRRRTDTQTPLPPG